MGLWIHFGEKELAAEKPVNWVLQLDKKVLGMPVMVAVTLSLEEEQEKELPVS